MILTVNQIQEIIREVIKIPSTKLEVIEDNIAKVNVYQFSGNLSFEFAIENLDKLIQIMEDIDSKFPGAIRKHDFWLSKKVHKERWLPEP